MDCLQEAALAHCIPPRARELRADLVRGCSREGHHLTLVFVDTTDRGRAPNAIFATCYTAESVAAWQAQDGWRDQPLAEEGLLQLLHVLAQRHAQECQGLPLSMALPDFGNFVMRRGLIRRAVPVWLHQSAGCLCTRGTRLAFMGRTMPGTP